MLVVDDDSLFDKVNKWPTLFASCCYCDVYSPWSHEAYVSIAERWLSNEPSVVTHFNNINCSEILSSCKKY